MDKKTIASNLLLTRLEGFIRSEGLLRLVPKHRQGHVADIGPALIWFVFIFFAGQQLFVLGSSVSPVTAVVITLFSIFAGMMVPSIVLVVQMIRKPANKFDPAKLGIWVLAGISGAAVLAPTIYLRSIGALFLGFLFVMGGVVLMLLIYALRFRIFALVSQIRLAVQMSARAIRLAGVVMPLLILLVFFSVFTEELWRAFYSIEELFLPVLFLLLYIPALLFAKHSVTGEIASVLESIPAASSAELRRIRPVNRAVEEGLVSREELLDAEAQVSWRDHDRLWRALLPSVRVRLNNVLGTLSIATTLVLMCSFALYLWIILTIMVPEALVSEWLNIPATARAADLHVRNYVLEVSPITFARAKVATVLGGILAIVAHVAGPADANVRTAIFTWLRPKIEQWKTAAVFYNSLVSRDIQIIDYKVLDERSGTANITAFVSPTATAAEVENACQAILDQRKRYAFVMVKAFPRHQDFSDKVASWRFDSWQMISNQRTNHYSFEYLPASPAEIHEQHYIGVNAIRDGNEVPEVWFGNNREAAEIAEAVWGQHRDVVLHPYVRLDGENATFEVRLMKRLPQSDAYQALIADIIEAIPYPIKQIDVYLYHRDEVDHIAHLDWFVGYASYTDHLGKKTIRKSESAHALTAMLRSPFGF